MPETKQLFAMCNICMQNENRNRWILAEHLCVSWSWCMHWVVIGVVMFKWHMKTNFLKQVKFASPFIW